jgi:hypothetical protein
VPFTRRAGLSHRPATWKFRRRCETLFQQKREHWQAQRQPAGIIEPNRQPKACDRQLPATRRVLRSSGVCHSTETFAGKNFSVMSDSGQTKIRAQF